MHVRGSKPPSTQAPRPSSSTCSRISPGRNRPDGRLARPYRPNHQLGDHRRGSDAVGFAVDADRAPRRAALRHAAGALLLMIEARRYRFFDVYRPRAPARAQLLRQIFAPETKVEDDWTRPSARICAGPCFSSPPRGDVPAAAPELRLDVPDPASRLGAEDQLGEAAAWRWPERVRVVILRNAWATPRSDPCRAGSCSPPWSASTGFSSTPSFGPTRSGRTRPRRRARLMPDTVTSPAILRPAGPANSREGKKP